jgi:hypothetical protein
MPKTLRPKILGLLYLGLFFLISCTSGNPNFHGSQSTTDGIVLENKSLDGDIWIGTETPGLASIYELRLKNTSDGTVNIKLETLKIENPFAHYPISPRGESETLCGHHPLIEQEACYIYVRFDAPELPTPDFTQSQFSIETTVNYASGSNLDITLSAILKARSSVFGNAADGDFVISSGTINTLQLLKPNDPQKSLFVYDELRTVTGTIGPDSKPLSRLLTYSADKFSVADEVMLYVTSADHDSVCAQNDLIGKFQFARILQINESLKTMDITPPIDGTIWKPVNADASGTDLIIAGGSSNPYCNIQVIRVPNFQSLYLSDATLLVPQYLNSLSNQQGYETKILGNTNNRTGGVLIFRTKYKLVFKNALIDAVGSGFNGGRRFLNNGDRHATPYGMGGSLFGWKSFWDSFTVPFNFSDIRSPAYNSAGDAATKPTPGSHIGAGGYNTSNPSNPTEYGAPSLSLPLIFGKAKNDFNIAQTQKFFLGAGGGYTNSLEFTVLNSNAIYDGGGFNGGGAVLIYANELESTNSRINASGGQNDRDPEFNAFLSGEFNKTDPNFQIDNSIVASVLAGVTSGDYAIASGTARLAPLNDQSSTDFFNSNLGNSKLSVSGSSFAIKFYLDSGDFKIDPKLHTVSSLKLVGGALLSSATISITNATLLFGYEYQKNWQYRASGAGGSIFMMTQSVSSADIDLIAEGGGSRIYAQHPNDNTLEKVRYGGGGGNIHLSWCGASANAFEIPHTSTAGGRTSFTKTSISDPNFYSATNSMSSNADSHNHYWGSGGLVSYLMGHKECPLTIEQTLQVKEIKPFAFTYRDFNPSTGTLLNPVTQRFTELGSQTINVGLGCKKGEYQNTYLEFKIEDNDLDGANIINVSLSLPAVGQTRWNDKFGRDIRTLTKIDRLLIGDSLKLRANKTLQSAYDTNMNLRHSQMLSQSNFNTETTSDAFTFEFLNWQNERYFDREFDLEVLRLNWPKNSNLTQPNLLTLIHKILPDEESGIKSPFQSGASLGFGIGKSDYQIFNGTNNIWLNCASIFDELDSEGPHSVYFKVNQNEYPKLIIHFSK